MLNYNFFLFNVKTEAVGDDTVRFTGDCTFGEIIEAIKAGVPVFGVRNYEESRENFPPTVTVPLFLIKAFGKTPDNPPRNALTVVDATSPDLVAMAYYESEDEIFHFEVED